MQIVNFFSARNFIDNLMLSMNELKRLNAIKTTVFLQDEEIGILSFSSIGRINSSPAKDLVMAQFHVSTD